MNIHIILLIHKSFYIFHSNITDGDRNFVSRCEGQYVLCSFNFHIVSNDSLYVQTIVQSAIGSVT